MMNSGKALRTVASGALMALLALAAGAVAATPAERAPDRLPAPVRGDVVPGEAIVRFEPGASASLRQRARREAGVSFEATIGLPGAQVVEIDAAVEAAVRELRRQPGVAYAQPNYRYRATAVEPPDDTFFAELWGLGAPLGPAAGVYALEAWESGMGAGQVIAILDTGVDLTHPDLEPNLWEKTGPDKHGYDFVDDDPDPDDFNYHGTHVAGTAAAMAGNGEGIAGVAPGAEIMAVRVLDGDGSGSTAGIVAGIDYAAENGADVINMSLGGSAGAGDEAMSDAIARAGAAGAVTVVAAGNEEADNDTEPHTPCALPNPTMICVAALNRNTGGLAGFSNYGEETVDLAAPGTQILSAKTDYGVPVFSEGFESGIGMWTSETFNGGIHWGESASGAVGAKSATDSPGADYGAAEDPEAFAYSELFTTEPVDLTGERGCRTHFRTKYEIEPSFDGFFAGAVSESPLEDGEFFDGVLLDGTSPGFPSSFTREEASISRLDGRNDAHPIYAVVSDDLFEFDGAYVDDVRLICRDGTYVDAIATGSEYDQPASGNYVKFQGTSMASPHVAGVVALVRAAAPGLSVQQTIDVVLDGTSAMPSPDAEQPTATHGIADACKAIAVALEADIETTCPESTAPAVPDPPPATVGGGGSETGELDEPAPPAPAPAPLPGTAVPDRVAPDTFIRRRPSKLVRTRWRRGRAVFVFRSSERGALFICQFDRKRHRRCGPRFVRWFLPGPHVLRVVARDAAGNVDRTPAVYRFRVKRVRP